MTSAVTRSVDGALAAARLMARGAALALVVCCVLQMRGAHADPLARADAAYARGDYVQAVDVLTPLALRGNSRAQAMLGFMFENGYGAPQAYVVAADLYAKASIRGNPFGQAMLGLMYDKGHGVPQDVVLAYKWLNLAAAGAPKHERDYFVRLRNAVASKMATQQIAEGQRLAAQWAVEARHGRRP
ncbi:tetratricopeptide repeat protein [Bradyrhizobium sp. HKCCYLS20291]|uniref:tetratricopeptide repeat protein n=1 Tax=Bradyrhizobium sp. HKCCYLS20291 TaxID=3420766 RepID=UPI003EBF6785